MRYLQMLGTLALAALTTGVVAAQQQEPSLGDVARKVRQEKATAKRAEKVFTNENLPTRPGAVSYVGAAAPAGEPAAAGGPARQASPEEEKLRSEADAELQKAKQEL